MYNYLVANIKGGIIINIGESIKAIRKKMNKSLRQLSHETGISASYLSELENNKKSNPPIETLQKISDALGIHVSVLLGKIPNDTVEITDLPEDLRELGFEQVDILRETKKLSANETQALRIFLKTLNEKKNSG